MQYLAGCVVVLILIGLLVTYWPIALAIAVIGGVIWWAVKASQGSTTTPSSTTYSGGSVQPTQPASPQRSVQASASAPVITIEYGVNRSINRTSSPGTHAIQWASRDDVIEVANYRIQYPMTYWASGKTRIAEASCIEKHLPVGQPIAEPKGALGYWPRYENMSPGQRANYLHWLATGKTGPLHDIGYAFVYFYGLERRVLIDGKDVNTIIPEVVRLLRQYPESGSFHGYLSRFIAFVAARTGLNHMTPAGFALCFEQAPLRGYPEELLAVILCWFYMRDLPLSARWAFEVARQDIRTSRSVVVDRAPEQFQALFVQKYQEKFGEGMKLKVAARERSVEYHPASPSLLEMRYATTGLAPVRVPNVLGIQSQFKPLVQIWAECIEELRSYSRALGKGADITTREAYESLPPALRKDIDHPDAPQWQSMASAHAREDGLSLISLSILAQIQGIEEREKLTPTQSQSLARTAEDIGFAIVPDARNTGRPYAWSDKVFLFHPEGHPAVRKDSGYHAAACMLELGMTIAGADGTVEQDELEHIEAFLEAQFQLSPDEVRRLEAYGLLLSQTPPTVASQSKQLREALTTEQRELIGKYLVGVAAANGIIDRKEISTLKAVYKALEIESGVLDSLLTELRHSSSQPVEVQTGKRDTRPGEVIPARERTPVEITINDEALIRIMAETAEVSRILGQALCDAESDTVADDPIAPQPQTPSMMTGLPVITLPFSEEQLSALDARYHAPLAELLARNEWSADEMAALAKRHLVMPSAMLDAINTWADVTLGDILIEDGDVYTINLSLVEA